MFGKRRYSPATSADADGAVVRTAGVAAVGRRAELLGRTGDQHAASGTGSRRKHLGWGGAASRVPASGCF